ncbi:MAG: Mov34/MPN/PAD-1 family protein, partial [Abditibacteriota bacterium]|nr:Mov34/MPN/PAD-1 family protein [Abditibacteriota bacterium]
VDSIFGAQDGVDAPLSPAENVKETVPAADNASDSAAEPENHENPEISENPETAADPDNPAESAAPSTDGAQESANPKPQNNSAQNDAVQNDAERNDAQKTVKPVKKGRGKARAAETVGESTEEPVRNLFDLMNQQGEADPPLATTENGDSSADEPQSIADRPPIFSYGGVKEPIADASLTFEELRIQKADDFPELSEGKTVSWRVKYGVVTRTIADPKGKSVASVKEEIEQSKAFLDGLKKAKGKDKNPDCLVTPTVTAKSKGVAAYKGFFLSLEEAEKSDKPISLIPSRNGRIYEMRRTEAGRMIVPKNKIVELAEVRAGFTPALPRIPREIMGQSVSFFRCVMNEAAEYEALGLLFWDRRNEEFVPVVPKQRASKAAVHADLAVNCAMDEDRYLLYADIHSHNSMEAKFSAVDDRDERASRLYIVIGRLNRFYPDIAARISCGGTYLEIDPELIMEGIGEEFPTEWLNQVERVREAPRPAVKAVQLFLQETEVDGV